MSFDFSLIGICFQLALFALFAVKAYGAIINHLIPFLRGHQQVENEKWFALQEKHAVLISKKKNLATQFLQQEKQIALLSAKLETWYKAWQEKEAARARFFEQQAQAIAGRRATQEKNIANHKAAAHHGREMLEQSIKKLSSDTQQTERDYIRTGLRNLEQKGKQ